MGVLIIFSVAYNMLLGQAGLLSFGHAIYFGLAGYASIHILSAINESYLPSLPLILLPFIGAFVGLMLGICIGYWPRFWWLESKISRRRARARRPVWAASRPIFGINGLQASRKMGRTCTDYPDCAS